MSAPTGGDLNDCGEETITVSGLKTRIDSWQIAIADCGAIYTKQELLWEAKILLDRFMVTEKAKPADTHRLTKAREFYSAMMGDYAKLPGYGYGSLLNGYKYWKQREEIKAYALKEWKKDIKVLTLTQWDLAYAAVKPGKTKRKRKDSDKTPAPKKTLQDKIDAAKSEAKEMINYFTHYDDVVERLDKLLKLLE